MTHHLKLHNTHAFIYTNHTIIRYPADFSKLHPIQMHKKVKGHLKFWIKFWIFGINFEFSIYTHPQKFSFTPTPKWVNGKGNNFDKDN